jgi:O-antigen ligase
MAGVAILVKRNVDWGRLLYRNSWIVLYLLYCLASVTWTDDPGILLKRWLKDLGFPIMALVILTEQRPYEALGVVLRRLAFVMLPLSIVFIKYYPDLGRWYRPLDGAETFTGVGRQKNDLGLICLMIGIYMAWELLLRHKEAYPTFLRQHITLSVILVSMLAWLQYMSNSQTSLVCLVVGIMVLLLGRPRAMARKPDAVFAALFCGVVGIWLLDQAVDLKDFAFSLLGRRPNLTDRTDIWQILTKFNTDPVVGVGFWSFWTGARQEEAWKLIGEKINQAHNGYLEQYLNLGYIGVAFIVIIMLSALLKIRRHLRIDPAGGMLRLSFMVVAILYNYTEAAFHGLNNMWMLLLLACLEIPRHGQRRAVDGHPSSKQAAGRVGRPVPAEQ